MTSMPSLVSKNVKNTIKNYIKYINKLKSIKLEDKTLKKIIKSMKKVDVVLPIQVPQNGNEWCLPKESANFLIKLSNQRNAFFKRISFPYVPKESSAIKDFVIQFVYNGMRYSISFNESIKNDFYQPQSFEIDEHIEFDYMFIHASTNHGNSTMTCLYPFEVYGNLDL